jgi:SWIM zinc finger
MNIPLPKSDSVWLAIFISGRVYRLRRLGESQWRLTYRIKRGKRKGELEIYDVRDTEHGAECSCADWLYRRQHTRDQCKHIIALEREHLLEPQPTISY